MPRATESSEFRKWFPLAGKCAEDADDAVAMRLVCFHGAGSDSQLFVSKGTARKPMENPLLDFCRENHIEFLPVHLPGRTMRIRELCLTSAVEIGKKVADVLEASGRIFPESGGSHVPILVVGHSMGCLCAYEFMKELKQRKVGPMPKMAFLSCMVSPDTPKDERPWKECRKLDSRELQDECREWAVNDAIFEPEMWKSYEGILRADFKVFDDYLVKGEVCPLGVPLMTFNGSKDRRVTAERMLGWKGLVSGEAHKHIEIEGSHSLYYDAKARKDLMLCVIEELDKVILDLEYE